MDMILKRLLFRADGILGELTSDDGTFYCFTLEHAYPAAHNTWRPKLPVGLYTCVKGVHRLKDLKPFDTFEIKRVPGATGILFHPGNFNNDSEGCVLLGEYEDDSKVLMVGNSKKTFEHFMNTQSHIKEFCLTVIDHTFSSIASA